MKVPVLLPNIFDHPFTYTSKEKLKIGDYVEVPFGKKKMIGIIWDDFEEGPKKKFKIKDIIKKFTKDPLENKTMRSSIYATILNGDIAFKDGQFSESLKFGHRLEFDY